MMHLLVSSALRVCLHVYVRGPLPRLLLLLQYHRPTSELTM